VTAAVQDVVTAVRESRPLVIEDPAPAAAESAQER